MKWIKQTFAQRYNRLTGRIGHIWGDRYWSAILEGAPPEGAGAPGGASTTGVRPRRGEKGKKTAFPPVASVSAPPSPG
jgi:hypothetical protein